VLDINEKILDVVAKADIVFWPVALDVKYKDVEAMSDKSIDVCFFNGAIRNSENEEMAKLLRRKAKVLVAFGSCAHEGCIPGLANLHDRKEIFQRVYCETPSTKNPDGVVPVSPFEVKEGKLHKPEFYDTVKTLDQTVEVDYYLPGCPIGKEQFLNFFTRLLRGNPPEKSQNPVCVTCKYNENECLLKKGILCLGPVTADGCGSVCINHNLPCVGCWGPLEVANRTSEFYLLQEKGYDVEEIKKKMANYSGTKISGFFEKLGKETR